MVSIFKVDRANRDYWDREVSKFENAHPLNAYGWGPVRSIDGWSALYLMAKRDTTITGAILLLIKRIPLTGLCIMYAPRGPVYELDDHETLKAIMNRVRIEAKKNRAIFLRIDPNIQEESLSQLSGGDPFMNDGLIHLPNRWSMWNAPRDVYRTDLSESRNEKELLKRMSPKARTGIRKAQKDGVVIRQANSFKDLVDFYFVFRDFATEKGFMARGLKYQKQIWSEFIKYGKGILLLAEYDGQIIGGEICLRLGLLCVEMHRGVSFKFRIHRVNEALVWEGMRWARKVGCIWYCQRGAGSQQLNKFKEKFDAHLERLVGYYDLPFLYIFYRLFHTLEFTVIPIMAKTIISILKKYNQFRRSMFGFLRKAK